MDVSLNYFLIISCCFFPSAFVYFADLLTFENPKIGMFEEGGRKVGAQCLLLPGSLLHEGLPWGEPGASKRWRGVGLLSRCGQSLGVWWCGGGLWFVHELHKSNSGVFIFILLLLMCACVCLCEHMPHVCEFQQRAEGSGSPGT